MRPPPAAASGAGTVAYVANVADNTVTPIDVATSTPGTPITVGKSPGAVAMTPNGKTVYVTSEANNTVTPINASTNVAETPVAVGSDPLDLAVTPDGKAVYVVNYAGDTVTPIDVATSTPGTPIPVGSGPDGIAITPNGATAYVANYFDNTVTPITLPTDTAGTPIVVGANPTDVAITPDGTRAYVSDYGGHAVTPITVSTDTAGTPIMVGTNPNGVAITPDGSRAYVANFGDNTVSVIDVNPADGALFDTVVAGPIPVGIRPSNIAITPDGTTAYVTNWGINNVTPIATSTNIAGTTITVGTDPIDVAITPDQAPVAELSVTPEPAGTPTSFDASASVAPSSAIVSYFWNFGDGHTQTTSVPTVTHTYATADTYTAAVTETDAAGTSTSQVFTGQTVSLNGGPGAVATASVVIVSCTSAGTCDATVSSPATPSAPAQSVQAVGKPTSPTGTFVMSLAPASLVCPKVNPAPAPVTTLTDTGFAPSDTITVTAVLKHTIRPKSQQVCFSSTVPFKSQSSPHTPKAGTALLLTCIQTHNVAPCVKSSVQKGPNVNVTFSTPGGDPRFHIVAPTQLGVTRPALPTATVHKAYKYQLNVDGGTPPIHWKISAGKLPAGLVISASTGTITGTPTKTGTSRFSVTATDSEQPPESSTLGLSITVN